MVRIVRRAVDAVLSGIHTYHTLPEPSLCCDHPGGSPLPTGAATGAAIAPGITTGYAPYAGPAVTIVTFVVGAESATALRQQQRADESTTAAWREDKVSERGFRVRGSAQRAKNKHAR